MMRSLNGVRVKFSNGWGLIYRTPLMGPLPFLSDGLNVIAKSVKILFEQSFGISTGVGLTRG